MVGRFLTPSLQDLRDQYERIKVSQETLTVDFVYGDVSILHADPQYRHATFQAASQFNCLEFIGPTITPEHGITGYEHDKTQGPACSIACGAATAYRNYLYEWIPSPEIGMVQGQSRTHMINNMKDLESLLAEKSRNSQPYFKVNGGYIVSDRENLEALNKVPAPLLSARDSREPLTSDLGQLLRAPSARLDEYKARLRVGVHEDVQVGEGLLCAAGAACCRVTAAAAAGYGQRLGPRL